MSKKTALFLFTAFAAFIVFNNTVFASSHTTVTTTVRLAICGDGIIYSGQLCDDGEFNGTYSPTVAGRYCNTTCNGWAPHCGDGVLQTQFNEECDEGDGNIDTGNFSTLTCSAVCGVLEPPPPPPPPPPPGGTGPIVGGVQQEPRPTEVAFEGKAYPNTDVNIIKDGAVIGIVRADGLANFRFSTTNITPGTATFGFWAEDRGGLRSVSFTVTTEITSNVLTTISGIFLPPTIDLEKRNVRRGEPLGIFGSSVPDSKITIEVNSPQKIVDATEATPDGSWVYELDTTNLSEDEFHSAKSMSAAEAGGRVVQSGFSQTLSFFVGEGEVVFLIADLNNDSRVNLVDFSILLFHWGTSSSVADINRDGTVNLADFSIMLFHWTG